MMLRVCLALCALTALARPVHAIRVEEYGCSLAVEDLQKKFKEERREILMKADESIRTIPLKNLKLTAKISVRPMDQNPDKQAATYWSNHRSVTVGIFDQKGGVQAQMNNTVASTTGTFEYQTRTTTYFVKLHCDPTGKIIVSNP